MKCVALISLVFAITFLSGCMPAYFVRVPALEGRVIDVQGKPIASAMVMVQSLEDPPAEIVRLKTGADGRFFRADEGSWGVLIAGMDFINEAYRIKATSGDRTSADRDFSGGWAKILGIGDSVQNFGDIPLR